MKTKNLLFVLLSFISLKTNAQWVADVRLTIDPGFSITTVNHAWCVAASGDTVHVVWQDNREGNNEIYYKRSTDGGISWGSDTRLTSNSATSEYPSVSVSGSDVHVIWDDGRDGNFEIYYKRSTDGGASWGADTRLTTNSAASYGPSSTVSGLAVHVVWRDDRDGNIEIYHKRSIDGGISWGADTRLTIDPSVSWLPSVSVSDSLGHVIWWDSRDGNDEIYYKRSADGGASWGIDTRLTTNSAASVYPCVSTSALFVHVVWYDYRDGNNEIYYKRSTDGGISWGADTRLTSNSAASEYPSVSVSGSVVHVVWTDTRDGNYEIYYKHDPTGNPVGIDELSIDNSFLIYPNPVMHGGNNFTLTVNGQLSIYNVLGEKVYSQTINNKQEKINCKQFSAGVYFVKVSEGEKLYTQKLIIQ